MYLPILYCVSNIFPLKPEIQVFFCISHFLRELFAVNI